MKRKLSETATNGVLLILAIATLWRFNMLPMSRLESKDTSAKTLNVGDKWELPGVVWPTSGTNVVAVMSPQCLACEQSHEFYRKLADTLAGNGGRLIVVGAESPKDLARWLSKKQIEPQQIVQVTDLRSIGISELPTVVIADGGGRVTDVVQRKLSSAEHSRFLTRVLDPNHGDPMVAIYTTKEMKAHDFAALNTDRVQIVDARSREEYGRSHRPGAHNIPVDELAVRGPAELATTHPVAVDCSRAREASACRSAGKLLMEIGFSDVTVILP